MSLAEPVGFIGTGAMGTEMVLRLRAAGRAVVVTNRTRGNAARAEQAGAEWVESPRLVAERAGIVLSCLLDSAAVERVYLGPDGLIEAARPGRVFVEHGTFSPVVAAGVQRRFAGLGAAFIDMPVTGGPEGTREGRLAAMAGGDPAAIEAAAAVVSAYCAQVTPIGGPGAGLQLKLVNQLLVSSQMASAAEAVALLHRLGIDLGTAGSVLEKGWAGSAMLTRALAQLRAGAVQGTGVRTGGMIEIQELIEELIDDPAAYPVFEGSRTVFERAIALGLADDDPAAMHLAITAPSPAAQGMQEES